MNLQPIEKRTSRADGLLEVHSIFYTIQGEGPFCGKPAIFIRLAGCNLKCPGCDTDYTSKREELSPTNIIDRMRAALPDGQQLPELVVITGGEPFRQENLGNFVLDLLSHVAMVQIETNGTLPPPKRIRDYLEEIDQEIREGYPQTPRVVIVCSPKTGSLNEATEYQAHCFKYVMDCQSVDDDDGLPLQALGHPAHPKLARPANLRNRPIYLQPMDAGNNAGRNLSNLNACVTSCMKHGYTLQLQIHKIIGLE